MLMMLSSVTDSMNETQLTFLREQLQESLCCWREVNDLPEFVDEELCDLVLACFIEAGECDSVETVPDESTGWQ